MLDLPLPVGDDRDAAAAGGDAGRLELVGADHHVHVGLRAVDAAARVVRLVVDAGVREAGAEGDVRGRVLVEQGVVVDAVRLADAGMAVDQRDLAEAVGVLDREEEVREKVPIRLPFASRRTSRPLRNSPAMPSMIRPWNISGRVQRNVPSVAEASGEVKHSSVGRFGAVRFP